MTKGVVIYLVTNLLNNKKYVGITTRGLDARQYQHLNCAEKRRTNSLLHKAIRRYGKDKFTFEHIATALDWDSACETERLLITQFNSLAPKGYNLTVGGEGSLGRYTTYATREKMSKGRREYYAILREKNGGFCYAPEVRKQMGDRQKGVLKLKLRGRERSEEARRKISLGRKGIKFSEQHLENLRSSHLGKKASEITRARMSETQKIRHTGRKEVICLQDSKTFPSINEAAQHYNVTPKGITKVLRGDAKTTHGLTFSYLNPEHNQQRSA